MSDAPVSVLLADDQALVRAGFSALVDAEDGLRVCAEVADGRAAVVARTARVITAAAAIMVAVFAAFALSPEVFLKLMGIGLATAVLVDATIVRMILVPAVMQLLGERAWWTPRWLRPRVRRAAAGGSPVSAD